MTTVRTPDGEVVITPNGQITQVTNLSRDWARAVVDVPVPAAADVNRVSDLLRLIGEEAYQEPELRSLLVDPPAVMGVQSIDVDHFQVRLVARTLPGKQFDVGRMLRIKIAAGLRREGINLPAALETAEPAGPSRRWPAARGGRARYPSRQHRVSGPELLACVHAAVLAPQPFAVEQMRGAEALPVFPAGRHPRSRPSPGSERPRYRRG